MQPISVRQLNLFVKSLLDGEPRLSDITVIGELSNFKNHYSSGHWYFTLKDNDAAVRCVMFKGSAARVKFKPCDGMQVILRARASVYEKDGQYQLYAEDMLPAGDGGIALAFEQIKQKLAAEGLFDAENKRALPRYPKSIAVVTSDTGAAVQDILNIVSRRYPLCEVILCPVSVQGEQAVPDMLSALDELYRLSRADVIIIGRGGGSVEDLWAFNSEQLARKIYESPIPVISAVGHETDFTICDFVADLRAPTPSAAAELAVPDIRELMSAVTESKTRLVHALEQSYKLNLARFNAVKSSRFLQKGEALVDERSILLDRLCERMNISAQKRFEDKCTAFSRTAARLDALSPLKVLARGYSVVQKDGKTVRAVKDIENGDLVSLYLADGKAECEIKKIL